MPDAETKIGDWSLLFVQFPGRDLEALGILLLDPSTNELLIKLGDLPHQDEEIEQIWQLLPEHILQQSREFGGAQALSSFEKTWSNTFQVGDRHKISIRNPQDTLTDLFREHIPTVLSVGTPGDPSINPRITRDDLLKARKRLPRSPLVAGEALRAIRSERHSTEQIGDIISEEPVLAAHLIRLANSALYQYRAGEVRSVVEAINRLGTNSVERQIVSACLRPIFASVELRDVWDHSIDVASVSGQLSVLLRHPKPEEAILVGLVHDIGRIVFASLDHSSHEQPAPQGNEGCPLHEAEQKRYGISHPDVGADLLADWNFPPDMVEAVRNHHHPQGSTAMLCSALHLAESWIEDNEDVWKMSDHAYALNTTKLSPRYFRSLKLGTDSELESLRLSA